MSDYRDSFKIVKILKDKETDDDDDNEISNENDIVFEFLFFKKISYALNGIMDDALNGNKNIFFKNNRLLYLGLFFIFIYFLLKILLYINIL